MLWRRSILLRCSSSKKRAAIWAPKAFLKVALFRRPLLVDKLKVCLFGLLFYGKSLIFFSGRLGWTLDTPRPFRNLASRVGITCTVPCPAAVRSMPTIQMYGKRTVTRWCCALAHVWRILGKNVEREKTQNVSISRILVEVCLLGGLEHCHCCRSGCPHVRRMAAKLGSLNAYMEGKASISSVWSSWQHTPLCHCSQQKKASRNVAGR